MMIDDEDYDILAAKLADAERVARYETDIAQQALDQIKAEKARAEAAEARIAHLENHIEGVAKDTHKIMVDLANPLHDPRVKALESSLRDVIDEYDRFRRDEYERGLSPLDDKINKLRDAISALEENK